MRNLLKKYMRAIEEIEGVTFVSDMRGDDPMLKLSVEFTQEELRTLEKIQDEIEEDELKNKE